MLALDTSIHVYYVLIVHSSVHGVKLINDNNLASHARLHTPVIIMIIKWHGEFGRDAEFAKRITDCGMFPSFYSLLEASLAPPVPLIILVH